MKNIGLVLVLLVSSKAIAIEGREGHGGNVVSCPNVPTVTLDYYNATLPTLGGSVPNLVPLANMTDDQVVDTVAQIFDRQGFTTFEKYFKLAIKEIGPIDSWISADLKSIDDANEPYNLPANCVRQTAANRQEHAVMYGDPQVINTLSPEQKGLLRVHEALYYLASGRGQQNSENVRNLVRALLDQNTTVDGLETAISRLGYGLVAISWFDLKMYDGMMMKPYIGEGEKPTSLSGRLSIDPVKHRMVLNMYSGGRPVSSSTDMRYAAKVMDDCQWTVGERIQFSCTMKTSAHNPVQAQCGDPVFGFEFDVSHKSVGAWLQATKGCPGGGPAEKLRAIFGGSDLWQAP